MSSIAPYISELELEKSHLPVLYILYLIFHLLRAPITPVPKYQSSVERVNQLALENVRIFEDSIELVESFLGEWDLEKEDRKRLSGTIPFVEAKDEIDSFTRALLSKVCDCKCEILNVETRTRRFADDDDKDKRCRIIHLYEHCASSSDSIQEAVNQDIDNNQLFRDSWFLHPRESAVFQHVLEQINNEPFDRNQQIQGTLTETGIRAAVVFSQSWRQGMVPVRNGGRYWRFEGGQVARRDANRQRIWELFNEMTRTTINNPDESLIQNYEFVGFYMALFTLPRYSFQYRRYDRNNNFVGYGMNSVRFPAGLSEAVFSDNVVLVRGSNRNYLSHLQVGNVVRAGTFASFSDTFQVALRYAAPPSWQRNDGEPTIIMIEEIRITRDRSPQNLQAYARPIRDLSLFPSQREYLIDPITRFQVVSMQESYELFITRPNGRKIPVMVVKLRYLDRKTDN